MTEPNPMTEREALIQLATPEPDYPVTTTEWQVWRDRTTAAVNLARALPTVPLPGPEHEVERGLVVECPTWLLRLVRHCL